MLLMGDALKKWFSLMRANEQAFGGLVAEQVRRCVVESMPKLLAKAVEEDKTTEFTVTITADLSNPEEIKVATVGSVPPKVVECRNY